jgi:hypothetical protein
VKRVVMEGGAGVVGWRGYRGSDERRGLGRREEEIKRNKRNYLEISKELCPSPFPMKSKEECCEKGGREHEADEAMRRKVCYRLECFLVDWELLIEEEEEGTIGMMNGDDGGSRTRERANATMTEVKLGGSSHIRIPNTAIH